MGLGLRADQLCAREGLRRRREVQPVVFLLVAGLERVRQAACDEPPAVEEQRPPDVVPTPTIEVPEPTAGRLHRLRARLARSQSSLGRGLLSVLSREKLDDDAWDEVEEALLTADVGVTATSEIVDRLRTRTKVFGTQSQGELRALLAEELVTALQPDLDRTLHSTPTGDSPSPNGRSS